VGERARGNSFQGPLATGDHKLPYMDSIPKIEQGNSFQGPLATGEAGGVGVNSALQCGGVGVNSAWLSKVWRRGRGGGVVGLGVTSRGPFFAMHEKHFAM